MAGAAPGTPRVLRAMNDRAALDLLLVHGPLSRRRVSALTGLSKPTATQLLTRLETAGLVTATGTSAGGPGPNAQLYAVNPAAAYVAGLDVGTAGIRAAVADVTGRTVGTCQLPTPARPETGPAPDAVTGVLRAVDGATRAAGLGRDALNRVVIGTPGAFDPATGQLRYATHLPGWHSPTLLEELSTALPVPVAHDNDVNLAAVAEQQLGAAAGQDTFVLLWNEQGIGAALMLGGRLHRGCTGGAGEAGFLPVPGTPLVRRPAQHGRGGFQQLAGAGTVLRTARELGLEYDRELPTKDAAAALLGQATLIAQPERPGTGGAAGFATPGPYAELLRRFAHGTAVGLAALTAVLDPPLIVLSGALLTAGGEPLRALVRDELAELAVQRPRLALGSVTAYPVLTGALESALATTRDEVFDTSR